MTNAVKLTFAGDSSQLDKTLAKVQHEAEKTGDSLDGMKKHAESAGGGFDNLGENLEGSTGKFRGGKDLLDGFSDSMGALGLSLPGPIGNIAMMAGGIADMADGIATTALPLLQKLWLAMMANPIFLVVGALAALTVGFVIAYKKSETFRNIVNSVFDRVKDAATAMGKVFKTVAEALFAPYRIAFNAIADAWNNTVGRLSFSIPGWVPGVGGKGFDVPDIPHFANGGILDGGLAVVGERGPEVITAPRGSTVIPANQSRGNGGTVVVLQINGPSDDLFVQWLRKQARVLGGGNVQKAFGRA